MLSLITGPQRSGKSYFCVTFILTYLQKTNRPILTNLPLNIDAICFHMFGKFERNPAKWENIFLRIRIFLDYKDLDVLRHFAKNNPRFLAWSYSYVDQKKSFHNIILPKTIVELDASGNPVISNKKQVITHWGIRRFWSYVLPNSIIFLDELYQYFSALDYKAGSGLRLELLTFTRQHGHDKHDLYLISHKLNDLDVCIRNGVQYLYVVRNMKYHNLFKHHLLRGFKSPVQFFRISGVMDCEYSATTEWDDIYSIKPRKDVFKCYDSFSRIETFATVGASDDASSSDINTSAMVNIGNYLKQSWIPLVMVGGLVVGLIVGVVKIRKFLSNSTSTTSVSVAPVVNNIVKKDSKVISVSFSRVVWDDGFILRIGDKIRGLTVYEIKKKYVVFSYGGKFYNVEFTGIRDIEKTDKENKKDKKA